MYMETRTEPSRELNLKAAYEQVCNSIESIDKFRAELLGLLPLVSGAGIFLLLNDAITDPNKLKLAKPFLEPIGIFGFVVTLGLFFYELHGIKKCDHLIEVGKQIERQLNINGRFTQRPFTVAGFINEPFTARIIYPAVLGAWAFVASLFRWPETALWIALAVLLVSSAGSFFFNLKVTLEEEPNISEILDKLLEAISPNTMMRLSDQECTELKERIKKLATEKRYPSRQDWETLHKLVGG